MKVIGAISEPLAHEFRLNSEHKSDSVNSAFSLRKKRRERTPPKLAETVCEWRKAGRPRFGYGLGMARFKRFRFSVLAVPLQKGFSVFQRSLAGKDGSGSGFGSWKTVPAVPVPLSVSGKTRGRDLNTNPFFLKLFGHSQDIPAKSGDIPPKKFGSLYFEGHTELFGPHLFTWKTPTPPENIRTKKFGFGFFLQKRF